MASAFAEKLPESGIAWEMESIKLNDFFSRDTSAHFPSVITENARLAARISRISQRFRFASAASAKARSVLEKMFGENPPLIEKLLIARALFDIGPPPTEAAIPACCSPLPTKSPEWCARTGV